MKNILEYWDVTAEELTEIIGANPSLRGMIEGYLAEHKLRDFLRASGKIVGEIGKYDDHDRNKGGDLYIIYKDRKIGIEVKSLQTLTIRSTNDTYTAKFQCDASDSRTIELPNGEKIKTTCLVIGEFDLLAVNLFGFQKKWSFAFARNIDLPRTTFGKYTAEQRKYLLATAMEITLPLKPPYQADPFPLFDAIVGTS